MIDYQEQSIASKTLINKKTGTVTLFAFDERQGLSEHAALFDALVHILDGEVEITISGNPQKLGFGDVMIIPANEPHALRGLRSFKMILTMIK